MRFQVALIVCIAYLSGVSSFAPCPPQRRQGTLQIFVSVVKEQVAPSPVETSSTTKAPRESPLFGEEINIRLENQMEKLRARDQQSKSLSKGELDVLYQDDHIVVVNKPAGILSVPTKEIQGSLSESIFKAFGCKMGRADMMVVHRLAFDSSGVMVFVKTRKALLGMNSNFQTRAVQRDYEALVCGHMTTNAGIINLPIMRDYERPPFMRISTDEHQRRLVDLEPEVVGKKILEAPKESITEYRVISREDLDGQPVTRVALTSVSGRTHQLNVHMAAIGHPIVGDKIYGYGGDALPFGGLTRPEMDKLAPNPNRPSEDVLKNIAIQGKPTCAHAKSIRFCHPVMKKEVAFDCDAPF